MFSEENLTDLSIFRKSICLHSYVPHSVQELIYNRVMKKENKGAEPIKVGYLKFLRLQKKELGEKHTIDDYFAFREKYQPSGLLYFLYFLPHRISNKIDRYKIEHLKLGKQKWRDGKLYIEKIPYFVSSEATMYLTAILRDYLRAFAKNTYAIGNALFEKDGEENNCFFIRAVSSAEEGQADGALEDWRKMVNDVADLFDKAADLCSAAWDHDEPEDGERLWKEYRKTLVAAFDALKPIFHDLDD